MAVLGDVGIPGYRFVEVDRITFMRTPKPSAHWYGGVIRRNAIPVALV